MLTTTNRLSIILKLAPNYFGTQQSNTTQAPWKHLQDSAHHLLYVKKFTRHIVKDLRMLVLWRHSRVGVHYDEAGSGMLSVDIHDAIELTRDIWIVLLRHLSVHFLPFHLFIPLIPRDEFLVFPGMTHKNFVLRLDGKSVSKQAARFSQWWLD